jgi:hypothetical protein
MLKIKKNIYKEILIILDSKISSLQNTIKETTEDRNNDTKSSAGDKYETGREMLQIEIQKNKLLLDKTLKLKGELSNINIDKQHNKVEYGSLVITNQGNYFISIGIGKIEINNNDYYSISFASPIGKLLQNKEINGCFKFQEKEFIIKKII